MSVLRLFPDRIRWCNPDGTLTREALAMLQVLSERVGGTLGDVGADVIGLPELAASGVVPEVLQPAPPEAVPADLQLQPAPTPTPMIDIVQAAAPACCCNCGMVQQAAPYTAGTALGLADYRFSLKDTAVVAGSYGSASSVAKYTVDQQGRLTSALDVSIQIGASQVTGLGTMATQNVGTNYSGSLATKVVTITNGIITAVT